MGNIYEIRGNRASEIIEIIVRDETGQKLDRFKCNTHKSYVKILEIIRDKYGYEPTVDKSKDFFDF